MVRYVAALVSFLVLVTAGCHSEEREKGGTSSSAAKNNPKDSAGSTGNREERSNRTDVVEPAGRALAEVGTYYEFKDEQTFNKLKEYAEARKRGKEPSSSLVSMGIEESVAMNRTLFIHSILGTEGAYTMCNIRSIKQLPRDGILLSCVGFTSDTVKYIEQDSGRPPATSFDIELTVKDGVMSYKGKKFLRIEE